MLAPLAAMLAPTEAARTLVWALEGHGTTYSSKRKLKRGGSAAFLLIGVMILVAMALTSNSRAGLPTEYSVDELGGSYFTKNHFRHHPQPHRQPSADYFTAYNMSSTTKITTVAFTNVKERLAHYLSQLLLR